MTTRRRFHLDYRPRHASGTVRADGRRSRRVAHLALLFALLAGTLALFSTAALGASPLEGRWTLLEQRYEEGRSGIARLEGEAAVELNFVRDAAGARAQIRFPDASSTFRSWPAVPVGDGFAPLTLESRTVDLEKRRVRAVYRIEPPDGRGWTLHLTEEYAVDDDGQLTGRLDVRMIDADGPRGGYVLHRSFGRSR